MDISILEVVLLFVGSFRIRKIGIGIIVVILIFISISVQIVYVKPKGTLFNDLNIKLLFLLLF